MERIENLLNSGVHADYGTLGWLPSLSIHHDRRFASVTDRVRDAWMVLTCRAVAVQWPHQRQEGQ